MNEPVQACVVSSAIVDLRDDRGRPRAVAVGFEPTNGLPRYTLSSSANQGSGTGVDVRLVLNKAVGGRHRTRPDDDE